MNNCTLVTGATGLIGRYLLRDLTLAEHPLCVVVRPTRSESPVDRIEAIMQMWDAEAGYRLPRPHVVSGDVTSAGLGLSAEDRTWVGRHCDKILHNAASLEFHGSDRAGEPWRTNLRGTEHLLKFCGDLKLRDLHYVSTAYVCGSRLETIFEHELDCGQSFRNDYEESKFLAESAVRASEHFDRLTIYRPAVVAGDSVSGYSSTYHGLYLYLKLISTVIRNIPPDADGVRRVQARWNCTGDEIRNIVPVDWVSAVMSRLFGNPAAWGQTYHLAPTHPLTSKQIVAYLDRYYNSTGLEFAGVATPEQLSDLERDGYSAVSIYQSYATTDPRFDMTNLNKLVHDLPCPEIDEAMMHRFVRFGEEDRWGKRGKRSRKGAVIAAPVGSTVAVD